MQWYTISYASDGNVEGSLSAGIDHFGVGTLVGRESVQNISHEQISGASIPKQSMVVRMLVPRAHFKDMWPANWHPDRVVARP